MGLWGLGFRVRGLGPRIQFRAESGLGFLSLELDTYIYIAKHL